MLPLFFYGERTLSRALRALQDLTYRSLGALRKALRVLGPIKWAPSVLKVPSVVRTLVSCCGPYKLSCRPGPIRATKLFSR